MFTLADAMLSPEPSALRGALLDRDRPLSFELGLPLSSPRAQVRGGVRPHSRFTFTFTFTFTHEQKRKGRPG